MLKAFCLCRCLIREKFVFKDLEIKHLKQTSLFISFSRAHLLFQNYWKIGWDANICSTLQCPSCRIYLSNRRIYLSNCTIYLSKLPNIFDLCCNGHRAFVISPSMWRASPEIVWRCNGEKKRVTTFCKYKSFCQRKAPERRERKQILQGKPFPATPTFIILYAMKSSEENWYF